MKPQPATARQYGYSVKGVVYKSFAAAQTAAGATFAILEIHTGNRYSSSGTCTYRKVLQ